MRSYFRTTSRGIPVQGLCEYNCTHPIQHCVYFHAKHVIEQPDTQSAIPDHGSNHSWQQSCMVTSRKSTWGTHTAPTVGPAPLNQMGISSCNRFINIPTSRGRCSPPCLVPTKVLNVGPKWPSARTCCVDLAIQAVFFCVRQIGLSPIVLVDGVASQHCLLHVRV
jgi:hypothetical protein